MQPQLAFLHRDTPSMTVVEPRGLAVRSVDYYRAAQGEVAEARVNRTVHDPAGRAIAQRDPRLFLEASAPANLSSILSLSDTALSTVSVDAGLSVNLFGEADQPVQSWDGRGSQRWMHYDNQLRLTALFEQTARGEAVCAERLTYAANDPASADRNQCGQLIRHDDRAGTQLFPTFGLTGGLLEQTRHFLRTLEIPDWPEHVDERDTWLEPGSGATTRSRFNPLGEAVEQTDAQGNRQLFSHTVAGQLREVRLQLRSDTTPKTLVSAIQYNAHGQTEREVAGNGVITTLEYAPEDARLTRLHARRGNEVLQDSHYEYDPTGNVLRIEDDAVPTSYFANQRIDPVNGYAYDSLNQLIRATGWEAGGANRGPQFSAFDDPAPRGNYCQSYHYDRGGNLLGLIHEGPQKHGHRLVVAPFSNRCLPVVEGVDPGEEDFRRGFDANGNLLTLQPGQTLSWDLRNQLCEVRPVERNGAPDDSEGYSYGSDGMRVRKVRSTQTNARTVLVEVRYLPGLEMRTHSGTGEVLHVINVQTGRSSVRVLHWETAPPKDSANDQYRFCLSDHLGSSTLELDSDGEVISQERYHPFGTTAWFAGRGEVEASRKTVRYSGKERDATGLYYYGLRYYVAWLQRWLSPDPAGIIDGLNQFCFVGNNPLNFIDHSGLTRRRADQAYLAMQQGEFWGAWLDKVEGRGRELGGLEMMQKISADNLIEARNIPLEPSERAFLNNFVEAGKDSYIVHFTGNEIPQDKKGDVVLRSRKSLQKKGIKFNQGNSKPSDIDDVGGVDFVYFSLDVAPDAKVKSRFGGHRYQMKLVDANKSHYVQYAHVQLNDIHDYESRQTNHYPDYFSETDVEILKKQEVAKDPTELMSSPEHAIELLGRRIIRDVRLLSPAAQEKIMSLREGRELGEVLNVFYRPQFAVPKKMVMNKTDFDHKYIGE
ncbi:MULTISPECIES: RHS repeat domain-containing protein [unclassified Pseudomonas]|uniref:RHS repeat domain-containing protein n=1 Tax=unclassified Pseudomonas TaxID=196821 RepID=UPI0002706D3B|nr:MULTISPECIES: RHS repeat-associated core domain-containing protein [unclassified Pseudomonas]EJM78615.1 RHS repeat-associated core domain protein-containing protein [Pseudomonas sp. GM67]MBD9548811.1 RHS repeat protein [Pseudomonas sp. PDM01]